MLHPRTRPSQTLRELMILEYSSVGLVFQHTDGEKTCHLLLVSNKSWHINENADTTFVTRLPRECAWQRQQCAVTTVTERRAGLSMSPEGGSGLPTPRARYKAPHDTGTHSLTCYKVLRGRRGPL